MTLIIGSVREHDMVLTSDGRSTTRVNGKVTAVHDTLQKLFPVPDHPVVIAHHGENILHDKPVADFIDGFIRHSNVGDMTIPELTDSLREKAYPLVREQLRATPKNPNGCGFWVGGFATGAESPEMSEIFWRMEEDALVLEERHWYPVTIVLAGDGKLLIPHYSYTEIQDKPLAQVLAYHKWLMDRALHAKVENNSVGGHVHELAVTRAQWHWTQPPAEHAPADK